MNCEMAIGMRRAAASLMLGWLVFLGRSSHVFAIAKIWGQGGAGVALLIPPDTHEEATQTVREQAHLLPPSHTSHVFAIAKMRNLEDVFPRQALSTGWGGSFRDSENEKKRIQTEAITDGQRKRT